MGDASNLPDALAGQIESAAKRLRLDRLRMALGWSIIVLGSASFLWAWSLVVYLDSARFVGVAAWIVGGILFVAADAAYFWAVDRKRLLRHMDLQLGLSDSLVSAEELAETPAPLASKGWIERQLADAAERVAFAERAGIARRRWPRGTVSATLVLLISWLVLVPQYMMVKHYAAQARGERAAEFAAVEEMFKDWENAEKQTKDEELRRLLEEAAPLREMLAENEITETEAMLALSRLEAKAMELKKALENQSLASSSEDLAKAFDPLEGLSALAAALRSGDFEKAEEIAMDAAEKMEAADAKMPQNASKAETQVRMDNAAEAMEKRGQSKMSEAARKMAEAMKSGDSGKFGKEMRKMSESFGKEGRRSEASRLMQQALAQLGQAKEGLGRGEQPGEGQSPGQGLSGMPRMGEGADQGKGAGSDTDKNRTGPATTLAAQFNAERVTGNAAEDGETETSTEKSNEPRKEAPRAGKIAAYQEYERLSRQAINDESLPVAHRQAIRRYFEKIRPEE